MEKGEIFEVAKIEPWHIDILLNGNPGVLGLRADQFEVEFDGARGDYRIRNCGAGYGKATLHSAEDAKSFIIEHLDRARLAGNVPLTLADETVWIFTGAVQIFKVGDRDIDEVFVRRMNSADGTRTEVTVQHERKTEHCGPLLSTAQTVINKYYSANSADSA